MTLMTSSTKNSSAEDITHPLIKSDELSSKFKDGISSTSKDSPSKDKNAMPTSRKYIIIYILGFFFAMIGHELALEAASSNFPELESLAACVTMFQFGFCFLLPLIITKGAVLQTFPRSFKDSIPYIKLSFLVFGATGLATQSLRYVNYPTKVIFKSAKLIPTMIVSTTIYKSKQYTPLEYFAALLICLGAAGYSYNPGSGSASGNENDTSYFGIGLLVVSIICDALVPNVQKQLMDASPGSNPLPKTHVQGQGTPSSTSRDGLSAQAVMINTNTVGFGMILTGMIITGSLGETVSTATNHPQLLLYLVCVGLGLSTAVLSYTKLIKASGPVVAVAVATLRKVVTIMLSYIIFPKTITTLHIFSGLLVLCGVVISTFCRRK